MTSKLIESRFIRIKTYKFMKSGGRINTVGEYCPVEFNEVIEGGNFTPFTVKEQAKLNSLMKSGVSHMQAIKIIRPIFKNTWGYSGFQT